MNGEALFGEQVERSEFNELAAERSGAGEVADGTTIWCLTIGITIVFTC